MLQEIFPSNLVLDSSYGCKPHSCPYQGSLCYCWKYLLCHVLASVKWESQTSLVSSWNKGVWNPTAKFCKCLLSFGHRIDEIREIFGHWLRGNRTLMSAYLKKFKIGVELKFNRSISDQEKYFSLRSEWPENRPECSFDYYLWCHL